MTETTQDPSTPPKGPARDLYDLVTGDENARVCRDIPESACRAQPLNFFIHLIALFGNKTGDLLASPKLVLPWLISAIGGPVWIIGLLVPLRESLALLPQLAVAGWIRRTPRRKGFWAFGALAQGVSVLLMIAAAVLLPALAAGIAILVLLAGFSLARGVCSAAYKDVLGKTITKNRRGTLSGIAASTAGAAAIGVAVGLWLWPGANARLVPIVSLLAVAGGLWLMAAAVFSRLTEVAGATEGGGNALGTAWRSLSLVWHKPGLARFITVRGLLIASALAAPYYATLAHGSSSRMTALALLLGLSGVASLVFAPLWGRFSDRSSRHVMAVAGAGVALINILIAICAWLHASALLGVWPYAIGFFLLSGLHDGVRLGRKTWLTDFGDADNRAQLTAVTNTLIGVILLAGGGFIAFVATAGASVAIAVLAVPALAAAILAPGLPAVE
mgnify:CR=1 FL=1